MGTDGYGFDFNTASESDATTFSVFMYGELDQHSIILRVDENESWYTREENQKGFLQLKEESYDNLITAKEGLQHSAATCFTFVPRFVSTFIFKINKKYNCRKKMRKENTKTV